MRRGSSRFRKKAEEKSLAAAKELAVAALNEASQEEERVA
jgi:hypothetical protein